MHVHIHIYIYNLILDIKAPLIFMLTTQIFTGTVDSHLTGLSGTNSFENLFGVKKLRKSVVTEI